MQSVTIATLNSRFAPRLRPATFGAAVGLALSFGGGARAADFSVQNIALGMTFDQVKNSQLQGFTLRQPMTLSEPGLEAWIATKGTTAYLLYFADKKLFYVEFQKYFSAPNQPGFADYLKAAREKYGTPTEDMNPMVLSSRWNWEGSWWYDDKGNQVPTKATYRAQNTCHMRNFGNFAQIGWSPQLTVGLDMKQLQNDLKPLSMPGAIEPCGKEIRASVYKSTTDQTLAQIYIVQIFDPMTLYNRLAQQQSISDAAKAAASAKSASQNKPQL